MRVMTRILNFTVMKELEFMLQEIRNAGGKTVWGDPAGIGKVVGEAAFDVVLDNNGKDLDIVKFVLPLSHSL